MSQLFLIQLVASFIIGGVIIGFLTLFAERVCKESAGVVLSLPSTMAVALFFMGMTLTPEGMKGISMVIPASLGASYIQATIYAYIAAAMGRCNRRVGMVVSAIVSCSVWAVLAVPLTQYPPSSLALSLGIYLIFILISHYFLAVRPCIQTQAVTEHFTRLQILTRSVVAGSIIAITVLLANTLGPLWGGIFSVFPAAMVSSSLITHWVRGPDFVFHMLRSMPLASPIYIVYGFTVEYTFPLYGYVAGTLIAYAASIALLIVIYQYMKMVGLRK